MLYAEAELKLNSLRKSRMQIEFLCCHFWLNVINASQLDIYRYITPLAAETKADWQTASRPG